ncbi:TonB-linked outer membrane protein, SusC/RagA family [Prevotellaceae bacterium MN60]|nr:TonB-linked outer membrane protein, SusC/RagA family [Prevotellaceae bacterium MN60]
MRRLQLIVVGLLCCLVMMAQERIVTGTVMDGEMEGEPLIGATVSIGDGKVGQGTITDYNGHFSLKVPAGTKKLTVSYVGYESKVITLTASTNDYSIQLPADSKSLNEVVVTGYQKIDRRKLTASVSQLNISDEAVGAVKNIDQALAGQIAGLSSVSASGAPGAPVKIRIRGTASINGVQEPLWVLDGIPMEGNEVPAVDNLNDIDDIYQTSIAGLNPSDIDNITVLKDAAATAIYGARAANGVIVITTKKGKEGRPVINFSTKLTYSPKISIDRLNLLNADEKVGLELDLLNSNYTYREHKGGVANILDELGEFNAYKTGGWDALSATAQARINQLRTINTDWNDILFRSVLNQEYNASISGGSDRSHYYASTGYYKELGVVKGVENNRYNVTLKSDFRINKILKLGLSVFANQRKQDSYMTDTGGFTNPVYYSRRANPYFQPYNADGGYNYDHNVQGRENEAPDFNIFEENTNTSKERIDRSVMAILDAEFQFNKYLKLTTQFGYQYDNYTIDRYAGQESYAMRKAKEYASYTIDGVYKTILPDGGMTRKTQSNANQWTWKAMLEWNRRLADIHDVELMAGTEVRHTETETLTSTAYGYDARTLTTQPVLFPTENIARQYPLHEETHLENAYVSWFATGSYTLLYRYTLGASVRFDGSDVFGVAKKYRYLPLYSVSGLWRAKEEKFLRNVKWLSELSLRASYGIQGNIDKNTSPYLIGTFQKTTILPGSVETVISAETAPNPDLKWEKTSNINLGLDLALLKNRIHLSVDYYYRKSTDLISSRKLPLETGFAYTSVNWASMKNSGWEIGLNTQNIKTKNFSWTTSLNLGFNTNEVLNETVAENSTYPGREGYPVGALFAYKTAGLDADGYPLFVAKDGSIQTATEFFQLNRFGASTLTAEEQRNLYTYMGSEDPKCSGGLINNFEYKNWQLGINFMFNIGMKVRVQPSYSPTYFDRGLNTNHDILNRWTSTNTNTDMPALMVNTTERAAEYTHFSEYSTYSMLDTWVKNCTYWRLQSLRLGYKLPKEWLQKVGINSASVSLEGRNLLVFASNYDNYLDPETMGNPYAQPIARSIIFGLNVNF